MDDQPGERTGDLRRGLEAKREDTHEVVAGGVQLVMRDGRLVEPAQLGHDLRDGIGGDVRFDGAAHYERPRGTAHLEARGHAVGVAALLAQEQVQARVEEPAEEGVGDREGMEVVDAAGGADMADPDLRLWRAWSIDQHYAAAGAAAVGCQLARRRLRGVGGPAAEGRGHDVIERHTVEVPAHDEGAGVRLQQLCVARRHHLAVDGRHGLLDAPGRSSVRRRGGIDSLGERLLGTAARVGHDLLEVIEAFVAEPLDLASGKAGLERHLGEQRHGR